MSLSNGSISIREDNFARHITLGSMVESTTEAIESIGSIILKLKMTVESGDDDTHMPAISEDAEPVHNPGLHGNTYDGPAKKIVMAIAGYVLDIRNDHASCKSRDKSGDATSTTTVG